MGRNRVAKPNKPFEHWRRAPYSRKRGKRFFRFQQVWAFLPKMLPFGAVFPPDHLQVMGVHKGVFMKKSFLLTAVVSLISIALSALFFTTSNSIFAAHASGDKKIHVIEHAITDTVVDIGPSGDSRGDILAFANPVFAEDNKTQLGSDNGHCFFFNDTATTEIYTLSLHDALPI